MKLTEKHKSVLEVLDGCRNSIWNTEGIPMSTRLLAECVEFVPPELTEVRVVHERSNIKI